MLIGLTSTATQHTKRNLFSPIYTQTHAHGTHNPHTQTHTHTQKLLHTEAFTHRHFTPRSFYTQKLSPGALQNRNFTSMFETRTSFQAKGWPYHGASSVPSVALREKRKRRETVTKGKRARERKRKRERERKGER